MNQDRYCITIYDDELENIKRTISLISSIIVAIEKNNGNCVIGDESGNYFTTKELSDTRDSLLKFTDSKYNMCKFMDWN